MGRFIGVRRGQEERAIVTSVPTHFDGLPGSANSYVLLLLLRTLTRVEGLGPCHLLGRGSGIPPNYMDFGRLSAGRGSCIPPTSNGARVSYPPNVYVYLYIYMDVAAGRRVRVMSQNIVSNIDGARVSYPPKLCPLIMGRGSRIPPTFGFSHRVGPVSRCR